MYEGGVLHADLPVTAGSAYVLKLYQIGVEKIIFDHPLLIAGGELAQSACEPEEIVVYLIYAIGVGHRSENESQCRSGLGYQSGADHVETALHHQAQQRIASFRSIALEHGVGEHCPHVFIEKAPLAAGAGTPEMKIDDGRHKR